jgi:KAP family P-loop domain.
MSAEDASRGYDLPIHQREEDFFDRWRFASELWQIVGKAPKDWSVRVGVYGRWGEGKTSVLNFLQQFAKRDGDVVVWFNPWSVRNRDELWNRFAGEIFSRFEEVGIKVKGTGAVKIKKATRVLVDPIQKAAELNQTAKVIIGGALSLFGKLLNANSETFKHIREALGSRRVIVIIDDLDRSDPQLLPELFLSLRDVLDLPGFSFVLGFDVDVVARALAEEYTAWGRGEEFLEKIIDFPLSLPVPSDQQLRHFLSTQIDRECPFVSRLALEDLFHLLPKNPRKLKLFVRHLWTLHNQISRHDDRELDWPTLFIWQLLKIESVNFCKVFTESDELFSELTTWRFQRRLANSKNENKGDQVLRERVKALLNLLEIAADDPRADRIEKLVEALAAKTSANDPGYLRYQIHIIDRPHAITWKEFNEAFSIWTKTHDLNLVDTWTRQHSEVVAASLSQTAQELFDCAIGHRRRKLDDAASAVGSDDYESHMRISSDALALIEALIQKGLPSVGSEFYCAASNFAASLAMVEPWLHFRRNPSDHTARSREREVLLGFAKVRTEDPATFLAVLKPWVMERVGIGEQSKLFDELIQELAQEIEPFVADLLLTRLSEKGGITVLWEQGGYLSEKWVLFNNESPLWRGDRRERLMTLLKRASSDLSIHGNALEFIHIVSEGLTEGIGIPYGTERIRKLVEDKEISGALWKAATARPVQYRSLSRVKTIREQFGKVCGTQEHLPFPGWMEAWDSQSNALPNAS